MTVAVLLLAAGLALIVAELLFPSLGMLGLLAALCLIGAIVSAFGEGRTTGFVFLAATLALVPGAIWFGFRVLPRSPFGRHLVLRGPSFDDVAAVDRRDRDLVGKEGVADSFLRPAGTAHIAGRRVDVQTRGEPIEAGARVRVLAVDSNRVVVERVDPAEPVEPPPRA